MDKKPHFIIQFVCFAVFFAAVLLQSFTHVIPVKPLNGFDNNDYDSTWDERAKLNTGFREFFIRSYNQAVYSGFGNITNDNIIEGYHHELYLQFYLNDYTGSMLRGIYFDVDSAKAVARKNVEETLRLIDTLHQFDIEFLFVFAPSKTWVYPEYIPEDYHATDFPLTDYYIELFKENNIPHIDFLDYFRSVKDTVAYPLYTRTGTHWAESTMPWVTDSILRKIEELTHLNLPKIQKIDNCVTKDYTDMDRELEDQMNLLFPLRKPAVPKPSFVYTDTLDKDRPNLLLIGDSYGTQLVHSGFAKVFNHWDFWVYNKEISSSRPRFNWRELKKEFDAVTVLQEADIVLVVFTQPWMYNYMFGFPDIAQELLEKGYFNEEEAMETVIQLIKDEPKWYEGVVEQAEKDSITIEESLTKNARYWLDCQRLKIKRPNHEE